MNTYKFCGGVYPQCHPGSATYAYSYILYIVAIVTITTPPGNTTVCRGSDVTISCGYDCATLFDPIWIINATHLLQSEIMNMSSYQLNDPTTPANYSLTILSINGTTRIRCIIASQFWNVNAALSPVGTVTVIGMCIMYIIISTTICESTCS